MGERAEIAAAAARKRGEAPPPGPPDMLAQLAVLSDMMNDRPLQPVTEPAAAAAVLAAAEPAAAEAAAAEAVAAKPV